MRDDLARHSEPDARSPDTSRLRFGASDKLLKDLLLFARWNADPAVSYTEGHALFFATKFHPDSETFGRVIYRIVEQVPHHAPESGAVGSNHRPRAVREQLNMVAPPFRIAAKLRHRRLQELRRVQFLHSVLHCAGFGAPEVQQRVH